MDGLALRIHIIRRRFFFVVRSRARARACMSQSRSVPIRPRSPWCLRGAASSSVGGGLFPGIARRRSRRRRGSRGGGAAGAAGAGGLLPGAAGPVGVVLLAPEDRGVDHVRRAVGPEAGFDRDRCCGCRLGFGLQQVWSDQQIDLFGGKELIFVVA